MVLQPSQTETTLELPLVELMSQLQTAVMLLDAQGRFAFINNRAETSLGISANKLLKKRYSYFIDKHSLPLRDWLKQLSASNHRSGSNTTKHRSLTEKRHVKLNNGQQFEAELTLSHIDYDNQEYYLIEWSSNQLHRKVKQEKAAQRTKQVNHQLLQNLAHEIKNPLAGIAGAAQLLQQETHGGHNNEQHTLFTIIQKETSRLSELVDRMLLGQKSASKILINIHEVLHDVTEFIQLTLEPSIQLTLDYDPSIPEVEIAPEQIYQVLLNLIQNAQKAVLSSTHATQKTISLRTRITSEHPLPALQGRQCLQITVIDNGDGIDEAIKPNIFFPLISGSNSSGLGLGIAQSLLQQHSGTIEFESHKGHTEFRCYLPLTQNTEQ